MSLTDFLKFMKDLIEESFPALAVMFWNYEESKVDKAQNDAEAANTALQIEKNHEAVDAKNSGKSDLDILNDAIASESGGGQPGASDGSDPKRSSSS